MSKSNTGRNTTALAVIAAVAVTGGVWYFRQNPQPSQTPQMPFPAASPAPQSNDTPSGGILPSLPPQQQGDAGTAANPQKLFTYTVATNDNGSHLEKKSFFAPDGSNLTNEQTAVLMLDAMAGEGDEAPLPRGTKATSVTFENDLATVDFNPAFQKNFTGGDENEALTLNAVLATLGQFPGVNQVQILVGGQKIDSLGGNQSLTEPLPIPNTLSVAKSGQ